MTNPREAPGTAADGLPAVVAELESTAAGQVERARQGDLRQALELGAHVETLLRSLQARRPEELRPYAERLARVERLQHHLELILAQQQRESTAQRTKMGRGKVALRAYGGR